MCGVVCMCVCMYGCKYAFSLRAVCKYAFSLDEQLSFAGPVLCHRCPTSCCIARRRCLGLRKRSHSHRKRYVVRTARRRAHSVPRTPAR